MVSMFSNRKNERQIKYKLAYITFCLLSNLLKYNHNRLDLHITVKSNKFYVQRLLI